MPSQKEQQTTSKMQMGSIDAAEVGDGLFIKDINDRWHTGIIYKIDGQSIYFVENEKKPRLLKLQRKQEETLIPFVQKIEYRPYGVFDLDGKEVCRAWKPAVDKIIVCDAAFRMYKNELKKDESKRIGRLIGLTPDCPDWLPQAIRDSKDLAQALIDGKLKELLDGLGNASHDVKWYVVVAIRDSKILADKLGEPGGPENVAGKFKELLDGFGNASDDVKGTVVLAIGDNKDLAQALIDGKLKELLDGL
ncbi:MAG: hypothetical protein PHS02_02810, partial [Candidatus ainarchaeum sp.]|nr:hypothetical protein [Candidatus ainarchaeum sp.]